MAVDVLMVLLLLTSHSQALTGSKAADAQTNNGILVFATAISTALVVTGVIVLLLGIAAVCVAIFIYKIMQHHLRFKEEPPNNIHTYEQVDACPETTESHDVELTNYNVGSSTSQEIVFQVSIQNIDEMPSTGPENPQTLEQSLVTTNPFYKDVAEMEDTGYLTGATYQYDIKKLSSTQEKIDLSIDGSSSYKNTRGNAQILESAAEFVSVDNIEGEIIEEVDYQNVTIIRAKKKPKKDANRDDVTIDVSRMELAEDNPTADSDDQDYLSIDSEYMKEDLFGAPSILKSPDTDEVYENEVHVVEKDENLYQNVSRLCQQPPMTPASPYRDDDNDDANSIDYENITPGMYKSK